MRPAYLGDISYYLPKQTVDNVKLSAQHPDWSVEKIALKTGINVRHIAAPEETASDMAEEAAEIFFREHSYNRKNIDFLLFCTQSPDYFIPTTACILQDRLGLNKTCGALDFNLGCSGFVYGLGIAKGLISSGQAQNVLLITAETYSKHIHPEDKGSLSIFGDGAAVSLVTSDSRRGGEILNTQFRTDGSGAEHLIVKNGAFRSSGKTSTSVYEDGVFVRNDNNLYMNGKEIFSFTAFSIPELIEDVLHENALSIEDISLFILHQANQFMLETIRKRSKIAKEKFYIYIAECANTVSSTIPIAIYNAKLEGRIRNGENVLLSGFGVGLSSAATILKY